MPDTPQPAVGVDPTVFRRVIPIIPARDVAESLAFYVQRLGFDEIDLDVATTGVKAVRRGNAELHISKCYDGMVGDDCGCQILVDHIESLYEEYKQADVVQPNRELESLRPGCREFSVVDPCGVLLTFCEAP